MLAIQIVSMVLGFIVWVLAGLVCGKICVQIIREKNPDACEVAWFWAGFLLNFIAVFMTFAVKDKKNDK